MDFEKVKDLIKNSIADAEVQITDLTGTQDHLGLFVKSKEFEGKMILEQHRMIMDILKKEFDGELHAVQIKTEKK